MRQLKKLGLRLRTVFLRNRVENDLDEELRYHLERTVEQLVAAGTEPAEARRQAMLEFGGIEHIKEECRDMRGLNLLDTVKQDLRYSARSLRRQPLVLLAATLSLGLAIGANTTIFSIAGELLLPRITVRDPERVVRIQLGGNSHASYPLWQELEESRVLEGIAGYSIESQINYRHGDETVSLFPLIVTSNFFDVIGIPFAHGRGFTASEAQAERNSALVVLNHGFWQRFLGGDANVVGRTILLNGRPYTICGILPQGNRAIVGFGVAPDLYVPLSRQVLPDIDQKMASAVQLAGRLKHGQTLAEGRAAVATAAGRLAKPYGYDHLGTVTEFSPLVGIEYLREEKGIAVSFAMVLTVVGLVVMIACANVSGLLLSRATARRREIAVRLALGVSRERLIQQMVSESFWLAVLGVSAGLLFNFAVTGLLNRMALPLPMPIELHMQLDSRLLLYSVLLTVATALLCGIVPGVQSSRMSLTPALKQEHEFFGHRRFTLRNLLVIGQLAVSTVLLVTAVLFVRNLARINSADPGFDPGNAIAVEITLVRDRYAPEALGRFMRDAADRLEALPGVRAAAFARGLPLTLRSGSTQSGLLTVEGKPALRLRSEMNLVSPKYFEAMGIAVRQGREFTFADRPGAPAVAIANEEFARNVFGAGPALGRRMMVPGFKEDRPLEIIGIVANGKYRTLGEPQRPAVYEPFLQHTPDDGIYQLIIRTTSPPESLLDAVRRTLGELDSSAAVNARTMKTALNFAFLPSRIGALILSALGILGFLLTLTGLYAVVAYAAARRTFEVGIRIALGASPRSILQLVLRDGALLVAIGTALGLLLALLVTSPLAIFLSEGLSPSDPVSFVGTAIVLAACGLLAGILPAWRSCRLDPTVALRCE